MSVAEARGARVYGEVVGYAVASDARGVGRFDLRGRGLERAMREALERSGLSPADIQAVWASAAGYRPADSAEAAAIRRVFGTGTRVLAPKRQLGEPIGAGGALNAALALKGWRNGNPERFPVGPVLVNSCSLGGTNFSIVLAPCSGRQK
jgi:3-oxoacyl-[acyl-carrier-protein] synthase II